MKFGPKGVRFTNPVMILIGKCLIFLGRQNTLHLQETALVVEGDLKRFSLPIFDWFVQRALCEWSQVTIPYSRIVFCVNRRYLIVKSLFWLSVLALLSGLLLLEGKIEEKIQFALFIGAFLCGLGVLVHFLFRPRFHLVYRQATGGRCRLCFRFHSRKQQKEFVRRLADNRAAARAGRATPVPQSASSAVIQGGRS